jgi:hypothetical protein
MPQQALALHRSERLVKPEAPCHAMLADDPDDADAPHLWALGRRRTVRRRGLSN